jgi:hypothetical protein|tara:strand:+ start:148 stop:501 length:354 start_codon:yes stop_codon:yes gene_type:complete
MITKDSGRLRIMEKLCSDKSLNTVLLVLANGKDSYFSSETVSFTAIENLLFEMAKTPDSSDKGTVYVNTGIRPIELSDLDKLIAGGITRVITNEKVGEGLRESAKELDIVIISEKDA